MPVIPRKLHTKYELNKTQKLFKYHYNYHGNLVTIAIRYVAGAYHTNKEASYEI